MTITITTSNVNGIRAAKRKGIEDWAGKHAPDVWCIQEVRAPQDDVDSIFDEFGFEYATAGKIEAPANLHAMNEVCRRESDCSPTWKCLTSDMGCQV